MLNNIIQQVNIQLGEHLAGHIMWKVMVTKDTCYEGKVLKIIATNYSKNNPESEAQIDLRYNREQVLICIPLQNHSSLQELSDYLNMQIYLAIQNINEILTNDAQ